MRVATSVWVLLARKHGLLLTHGPDCSPAGAHCVQPFTGDTQQALCKHTTQLHAQLVSTVDVHTP